MFDQISDPRIAQGFRNLMGAFGGAGAADIIQADLDRRRGNLIDAQVTTEGAQADSYNALAGLRRTEANEILAQRRALEEFGAALGLDMSTQEGRTAAAAAAAEAGITSDQLAGYSTFSQPNALPDDAFSRVILGTGVVGSHGDTPVGTAEARAAEALIRAQEREAATERALREAELAAQADRDVATIGADADRDVARIKQEGGAAGGDYNMPSITQQNQLYEEFIRALTNDMGEVNSEDWRAVQPYLNEAFRATEGDAAAAIQLILGALPSETVTEDPWFGAPRTVTTYTPDAAALASNLNAALNGARGGTPAPARPAAPPARTGQRPPPPPGTVPLR